MRCDVRAASFFVRGFARIPRAAGGRLVHVKTSVGAPKSEKKPYKIY